MDGILAVSSGRCRRDWNGKSVAAYAAAGGRRPFAPASFLRGFREPRCSLHSAASKSNGCFVCLLVIAINLEFGIGQMHLRNRDRGVLGCMRDSSQSSRALNGTRSWQMSTHRSLLSNTFLLLLERYRSHPRHSISLPG